LKILNEKPFQKLPGCRASAFVAMDKPELKKMPQEAYHYRKYKAARAGIDYHVVLQEHYYSVPHKYCGELIDLWFNQHTVECYFEGERIAMHLYSNLAGKQSTISHHMPKRHRIHTEQSKERYLRWANQVGTCTHIVVKKILDEKPHPEQAYRSCLGILKLAKRYGESRLEQACSYGVHQGAYSRKSVLSILENNLDQRAPIHTSLDVNLHGLRHENIRGSQYYH
jgi:transposase